jgi:hypothetical protein
MRVRFKLELSIGEDDKRGPEPIQSKPARFIRRAWHSTRGCLMKIFETIVAIFAKVLFEHLLPR